MMEVSLSTRQAYSEIDEFLNLLNANQRDKIPIQLRELFVKEKDQNYIKGINLKIPIKDQNLKDETLSIIALLNLKYWCEDEEEKERLMSIYEKNEEMHQKILNERFSPNDIFNKEKADVKDEQVIQYKDSIIRKILNRILKFFHLI